MVLQQVAPAYQQVSGSQKQTILDEFVTITGYALWLPNHAEEVLTPPTALRRRYGQEVEEALVLIWKTRNRICAKRLIPFLPDLFSQSEENGQIRLSQEQWSLLLSMTQIISPVGSVFSIRFPCVPPLICQTTRDMCG